MIKYWVFLSSLISFSTLAQSIDLGNWNILNLKYRYNEKWSVFAEAQLRSLRFYTHFHYYEYKGGTNFKPSENLTFSIGAGSYQTYKEGGNFVVPKNNNEIRIWPQILIFQPIGKLKMEQRYRTEFRFTDKGYRNRYRYRLGVSYLFGKERDKYKPFQISLSNELFFTDKEPYFERNRLQLAFNYKPSKGKTIQIGYLHQFDYKINDETGRDFLQLGYFIDLYKNPSNINTTDTDLKDN